MTDEQRLDILAEAALMGFSGQCGEVAIAINEVLFDGKGEIVGAVNIPLYRREDRLVGHVGVRAGDAIWDAEGSFDGERGMDEFLAWGMLDPEDSSYAFEDWDTEPFDADIITLTPERVRELLPMCSTFDPARTLREAKRKVLARKKPKKKVRKR